MKKLVLSLAVIGALFVGCSEDKKETSATTSATQVTTVAPSQEVKPAVVEDVKKEIAATATQVQEKTTAAVEEVKKEVAPVAEALKEQATTATAAVEQKAEEVAAAVTQEVAPVNQKGMDLYVKCSACHGQKAEKKALGTSQIIKGWSVEQITSSLKGYKNKTYGGSMKTIMNSQVATLKDDDIEAVAQYISGL